MSERANERGEKVKINESMNFNKQRRSDTEAVREADRHRE